MKEGGREGGRRDEEESRVPRKQNEDKECKRSKKERKGVQKPRKGEKKDMRRKYTYILPCLHTNNPLPPSLPPPPSALENLKRETDARERREGGREGGKEGYIYRERERGQMQKVEVRRHVWRLRCCEEKRLAKVKREGGTDGGRKGGI